MPSVRSIVIIVVVVIEFGIAIWMGFGFVCVGCDKTPTIWQAIRMGAQTLDIQFRQRFRHKLVLWTACRFVTPTTPTTKQFLIAVATDSTCSVEEIDQEEKENKISSEQKKYK